MVLAKHVPSPTWLVKTMMENKFALMY